ncbi:MAG: hypothetical protein LC667_16630, partial [Thioalkalivibrio sp.]|nr:hypothetical protein [Thioalkalivibrio sp.]
MSVLQHIVRTRLVGELENVATDAVAYLLLESVDARRAMVALLRTVTPGLPEDLAFAAQVSFASEGPDAPARPDLVGSAGSLPRVFVENKFWAGLTDRQPLGYLAALAEDSRAASLLLFVVPDARVASVWHELLRRASAGGVAVHERPAPVGIERVAATTSGPDLAITTWRHLLDALELGVGDDPSVLSDLAQLRDLCLATDAEAFVPLSAESVTDQAMAAFVLRLGRLVRATVDLGVSRRMFDVTGLRPSVSWERTGQYLRVVGPEVGIWLGTHFQLWRDSDATPLWVVFSGTEWGRGDRVRALVE